MRLPPQWAYESIGDGGWDDEVIEDLVEENERLRAQVAAMQGADIEALLGDRFTVTYAGRSWKAPGAWFAVVRDKMHGRSLVGRESEGIGSTIEAAIRAAVEAALGEATDGE